MHESHDFLCYPFHTGHTSLHNCITFIRNERSYNNKSDNNNITRIECDVVVSNKAFTAHSKPEVTIKMLTVNQFEEIVQTLITFIFLKSLIKNVPYDECEQPRQR